jgi:hypothetical protein
LEPTPIQPGRGIYCKNHDWDICSSQQQQDQSVPYGKVHEELKAFSNAEIHLSVSNQISGKEMFATTAI